MATASDMREWARANEGHFMNYPRPHELGYYRGEYPPPVLRVEHILMAINANLTRIADVLEKQLEKQEARDGHS